MKILITGSQGYIGTFLTRFLSDNGIQVSGMDVGYYKDCNLIPVDDLMSTKCIDIRDIGIDDVMGFDAIVHLAALSNDPVGELDQKLTFEIFRAIMIREPFDIFPPPLTISKISLTRYTSDSRSSKTT